MGLQPLQIEKGKAATGSKASNSSTRSLLNSVEISFTGNKPPLM